MKTSISRREFLKICSMSLAGILLPINRYPRLDDTSTARRSTQLMGRIQVDRYPLYQKPSKNSEMISELGKDRIHRITGSTMGIDDLSANRIWYQLDNTGYAHSKYIQPVRVRINAPTFTIPENGCLGEITVPYVDAYSSLETNRKLVYRFYYASTFWVTGVKTDDQGAVWYQLLDDRNYGKFYIPAYSLRMVPREELTPLSPQIPYEDKKLIVDLNQQTLTAYEGERIIKKLLISSGIRMEEGGFATPRGSYRTTRKRPCRHMVAPPSEIGTGFDLPGVPWVSYFTVDGVALHGTYWHNDYGVPHSHGCINLSPEAAKWVYRWTTPSVPHDQYFFADDRGTRVVIQ